MTSPSAARDVHEQVRLVVADVDGTLVTPDKILTPRARAAVRDVIDAGIAFTITSGRPPLGMKMLIDELQLRDPITAFNGGLFIRPDLSVIRKRLVPRRAVQLIEMFCVTVALWSKSAGGSIQGLLHLQKR